MGVGGCEECVVTRHRRRRAWRLPQCPLVAPSHARGWRARWGDCDSLNLRLSISYSDNRRIPARSLCHALRRKLLWLGDAHDLAPSDERQLGEVALLQQAQVGRFTHAQTLQHGADVLQVRAEAECAVHAMRWAAVMSAPHVHAHAPTLARVAQA